MTTDPDPLANVLADRYVITGLLGTGGMGRVYEGYDINLDRRVALKTLDDPSDPVAIRQEAIAAARINDRRVVTVLDLCWSDGRPFIVLEALAGDTLADELEDGALPGARFDRLVDDLVGGLAAAHRHGVLHRDVKPANVLLREDGYAITDFGLASYDGSDDASPCMGTLVYLPPERLAGADGDESGDVFSAAVVLFEALTGTHPFRGETTAESKERIMRGLRLALPGDAPATLAAAIDAALDPVPSRRPADAGRFLALLRGDDDDHEPPAVRPAHRGDHVDQATVPVDLLAEQLAR